MRTICIILLAFSCMLSSCKNSSETKKLTLVVLDPGHFHAALVQKDSIPGINDTVYVYIPMGKTLDRYGDEANMYINNISDYNRRSENPTNWVLDITRSRNYVEEMVEQKKGDIVVLAGNNQKKTSYILESVKAGFNVLSDKPMAINADDFTALESAYEIAKEKNVLLYELMTERYDILNIVEKALINSPSVFGELQKGSLDDPAITMESVHHFYKNVSGKALTRPAWYYDVEQQGEGIADVTTHLIDLVNWQCFPNKSINYKTDVNVLQAIHFPTPITLEQYSQSTGVDSFPPYLEKYIDDNGILQVMSNGCIYYSVNGYNVCLNVTWNYEPPVDGGDLFSSKKNGSLSTLVTIQNKSSEFVKQLYIQQNTNDPEFENKLKSVIGKLGYDFITIEPLGDGLFNINIPTANRPNHEAHFGLVTKTFLSFVRNEEKVPAWEFPNTIAKYYITTKAVELAKNRK